MFSKVLGSALGAKIAGKTGAIGGSTGAMIGAAAPFVLRKMSIPAMIAVAAGGYAWKKYSERKQSEERNEPNPPEVAKPMAPATA